MDVLARYSYDDYSPANAQWGRGLRTGMIDGSGSTSWRYDAGGRLNLEQKSITGSGTYSTRWGYNAGGQLAWMQYPGASAEKVTYSYHPQMALNGVTGSGTYVQSMRYDAAGRMTQIVRGAGTLTSSYSYYGWTETAQVGDEHLFQGARLKQATTGGLQNLSYLYDEAGNVVRILDAVNSSQKQCFQYDILDRLTQATTYNNPGLGCTAQVGNGNYHQNYSYNPDTGNLLSKDGTGTYNYDDGNHKHAVTHLGEVQKHWYDLNGNMTTRVAGATTYTQGWDAENRLVSVSGGGLNSTFGYDGDGTRVKGVVAGATTAYVGNWFEWTGSTSTMKKYYYAGSQRIAMRSGSGTGTSGLLWMFGDHLGSTTKIANYDGTLNSQRRYRPWGYILSIGKNSGWRKPPPDRQHAADDDEVHRSARRDQPGDILLRGKVVLWYFPVLLQLT